MLKTYSSVNHKILIIGAGASALTLASKLVREGEKDIGIYALAYGASPLIAGINFLTEDTAEERELYINDMLGVGYHLGDKELVQKMVDESYETLGFMEELGVAFIREGSVYKKRHLSGHSKPRTLYNTEEFIGTTILRKEKEYLKENSINIELRCECLNVFEQDGIRSAVFSRDGKLFQVNAEIIVFAWGGIGSLLGESTYPKDIYGNTLTIADNLGIDLVDLEFIEFEPMVLMHPSGVKGEPCPTAMLGEGAFLLNSEGERFLLKVLDKESGAPKSIINNEIQNQLHNDKGSEYGGVWADLRHIPIETLKGYPWFYNLLMKHGVDPNKELLNVGPMKHSLSGGIKVDSNYKAKAGFYAIGEAAGGIHGACRSAGNGGAQAVISGYIAAKGILSDDNIKRDAPMNENNKDININYEVFNKYKSRLIELGNRKFSYIKTRQELEELLTEVNTLLLEDELKKDLKAYQAVNAVKLVVQSALNRDSSVGSFIVN